MSEWLIAKAHLKNNPNTTLSVSTIQRTRHHGWRPRRPAYLFDEGVVLGLTYAEVGVDDRLLSHGLDTSVVAALGVTEGADNLQDATWSSPVQG